MAGRQTDDGKNGDEMCLAREQTSRDARESHVHNFHSLRHTAITSVYRATEDLFLTQRFARHASPVTTIAYTHPSDEELYAAIRGIET